MTSGSLLRLSELSFLPVKNWINKTYFAGYQYDDAGHVLSKQSHELYQGLILWETLFFSHGLQVGGDLGMIHTHCIYCAYHFLSNTTADLTGSRARG